MKKYITRVKQLGPDPEDQGSYEMLMCKLGTPGHGAQQAWVRTDRNGWREKPGYSKLYYDRLGAPHYLSPGMVIKVNQKATELLRQPDTRPVNKRSRLLRPNESVLGFAWLVDFPGTSMECFPLRACHRDEVYSYIAEHHEGDFEVHDGGDKLYVAYCYDQEGSDLREQLLEYRQANIDEGMTLEEIDEMVAQYQAFPVYARLMWA